MADNDFPKGMFFKLPNDKAPDFVKGKFLIHVKDAVEYLQTVDKEWLSLDAKVSKDKKPYLSIDKWEPTKQQEQRTPETQPAEPTTDDDLPF